MPESMKRFRRASNRRSWSQRIMLSMNVTACGACFVGSAGLLYMHDKDRIQRLSVPALEERRQIVHAAPNDLGPGETLPLPSETITAQNWLITGSDSRDCIDPSSPYANAFLGESVEGGRSDTIMVMRIDPAADHVSVLSFPRDLWVRIAGTSRQARINSAYDGTSPDRLVRTIRDNFDIPLDHWADIDFCAFAELVDAVGGVSLRFAYPTRDRHSGLNIPLAECHRFSGDEALAYVRSRKFEWTDGSFDSRGRHVWQQDPTSDIGRIRRQQEFMRAIAQRALDTGVTNPRRFDEILDAVVGNITVDDQLPNGALKELALFLVGLDPSAMQTHVVQGTNVTIEGAAVIRLPRDGQAARANEAVYALFRGESPAPTSVPPPPPGGAAQPPPPPPPPSVIDVATNPTPC